MFKKKFKLETIKGSYETYFFYSKNNIFSRWKIHYIATDEVDRDNKKTELGIV